MQMEWRVPGGKVLPSWRKSDSCVMNRPSDSMKHISMLDADQHADTPDDCMPSRMTVTMKAIWMRFDGSMLNVFMISPLHTMALPGRARTLTGKAIPAS